MKIPEKTIERICRIYGYLSFLEKKGVEYVSSRDLARSIGATEYMVRKDISLVDIARFSRRGYEVSSLKAEMGRRLNLDKRLRACIVGLGRLGTALADYENFRKQGFEIAAGFDNSVNKLERIQTRIEVFPYTRMKDVIEQRSIELGIITVPARSAQEVADRLVEAGVHGILNFSPVNISVPEHIVHLNMDFTDALRFIAVKVMGEMNRTSV